MKTNILGNSDLAITPVGPDAWAIGTTSPLAAMSEGRFTVVSGIVLTSKRVRQWR